MALRLLGRASPDTLHAADRSGASPVLHAARGGHSAAVGALAELGVSVGAALRDALRDEAGELEAALEAARLLAPLAGCESLLREAVRVPASPALLRALLLEAAAGGRLAEEVQPQP